MGITNIQYRNIPAIKLSFNNYSVTILYGRGCNIIEFTETSHNLSILHYPEDNEMDEFAKSPQRFGSAILFHPNKIDNGSFFRNNKLYDFSEYDIPWSHGIIKELPFQIIETKDDQHSAYIKCRFNSQNTVYYTKANWDFTLDFEFTLSDEGLTHNMIFTNNGQVDIPFGLGFHTAFKIPFSDSSPEQYRAYVSCQKRWEVIDGFPTGQSAAPLCDYTNKGVIPLNAPIAEPLTATFCDFSSLDNSLNNFHGAVIYNQINNIRVIYETDSNFPQWMIWNNNASDNYICIEPMTWIINAPNSTLPDSESGFQFITPNQTFEAKNRLYVKF